MKIRTIIIITIVLFSASCRNTDIKTFPTEFVRVRITDVKTCAVRIPVHSNGILVSSEELRLSFKTGGIVAKIYVREGDRVRKGDLLAILNLSEINANVEQAKNGYDKALRDYRRAENLYRDSVSTLEQKQNAATALNVAKSTLEIVQFNLTHSRIVAPDDGLILKQFVRQNELVLPFFQVFLFGSSGKHWKVKSGLSDKDIVKINPGDSAEVFFDAYPGVKFPAVVDQVGEISNPYTGTYETELLVNGLDYRLASGFVAAVDIFPIIQKTFSIVPIGSIVEADGRQGFVYFITDSMTAKKQEVEIEMLTGSMAALKRIPDGITEIVSEGAAYLKDGMKVMVVK